MYNWAIDSSLDPGPILTNFATSPAHEVESSTQASLPVLTREDIKGLLAEFFDNEVGPVLKDVVVGVRSALKEEGKKALEQWSQSEKDRAEEFNTNTNAHISHLKSVLKDALTELNSALDKGLEVVAQYKKAASMDVHYRDVCEGEELSQEKSTPLGSAVQVVSAACKKAKIAIARASPLQFGGEKEVLEESPGE